MQYQIGLHFWTQPSVLLKGARTFVRLEQSRFKLGTKMLQSVKKRHTLNLRILPTQFYTSMITKGYIIQH